MTVPYDEAGSATALVDIPGQAETGRQLLWIVGEQTGTEVKVPIRITDKR